MSKILKNQDITLVLADVANAVVGHFDMNTLLDQIIDITMKSLNAEVCSIFLEDKENEPGVLKCVAGSGFAEKIVGIAEYKIGEGLTGMVAETGIGYNSKNRKEHESLKLKGKKVWRGKFDNLQWPSGESEFRSGIALPLKIKDQTLGVIKAENKIIEFGNYFSEEDLNVFKTIANVIALAIQNTKLHQQAEIQLKTISSALADVAGAVVGHFDMKSLLDQIINITMETLNAEVCSIFLEDKENEPGVLRCVAGSGFAKKIVGIANYKIGEGLTGAIAKSGGEFNIKSREELKELNIEKKKAWKGNFDHLQWPDGESQFRNLLALPLKIKDQILGVMKVENKLHADFFSKEDEDIFKTIASVIALTIEKTRLQLQTEDQLKTISAMASHRINNQVTRYDGINSKLKRLINNFNYLNLEDLKDIKSRLEEATTSLKKLIDDFRNYGKKIKLQKELLDINQIIRDEIWYAEPPHEVTIHESFDYEIPKIEIDRVRFTESIKELLSNSIRVLVAKGNGNIYISTKFVSSKKEKSDQKLILIRIEDDGPGFPNNFPVFKPFYSSDPNRTGLGLATVKQNLEAHGGTINHIDENSLGACFDIYFPIQSI